MRKVGKQLLADLARVDFLRSDDTVLHLPAGQRQLFEAYGDVVLGLNLEQTLQHLLHRAAHDIVASEMLTKGIAQRKLVKKILKK